MQTCDGAAVLCPSLILVVRDAATLPVYYLCLFQSVVVKDCTVELQSGSSKKNTGIFVLAMLSMLLYTNLLSNFCLSLSISGISQ